MESERPSSWFAVVTLGSYAAVACLFLFVGIAVGWFFGNRELESIREENKRLAIKIEDLESKNEDDVSNQMMQVLLKNTAEGLRKAKEQSLESDGARPVPH